MSFEIDRPIHLFSHHSPMGAYHKEPDYSPTYDPSQAAVSPTYSVASSSNCTSSSFESESAGKPYKSSVYDHPSSAMPVSVAMSSPHSGTFSEQSVTGTKRNPLSPLPEAFFDCSPNFTTDQLRAPLPTPPASDMSHISYGWREGSLKSPPGTAASAAAVTTTTVPFPVISHGYDAPPRPAWPDHDPMYYATHYSSSTSDGHYPPAPTPTPMAFSGMMPSYDHPPLPSAVLMPSQASSPYILHDHATAPFTYATHSPQLNAIHHPQRRPRHHPYVNACCPKPEPLPSHEPRATTTTPRRYKCTVCVKRFTRPSSLATHMHSHTGEKPYKCTVDGCGRRFSVVSNLRRHAKIHQNNHP